MLDFGPTEEKKPHEVGALRKKLLIIAILLIVVAVGIIAAIFLTRNNNPLPEDIKSQLSYKAVYPSSKTGSISQTGYQYQADQKTLSFAVDSSGNNLVFAEQPAPASLGSGSQVYFQAIGLHPYAQFQSELGPVALAKFYQSGNLKPVGQTAVLVTNGTLVTIHPDKDLTNEQWKDLINSLKIIK